LRGFSRLVTRAERDGPKLVVYRFPLESTPTITFLAVRPDRLRFTGIDGVVNCGRFFALAIATSTASSSTHAASRVAVFAAADVDAALALFIFLGCVVAAASPARTPGSVDTSRSSMTRTSSTPFSARRFGLVVRRTKHRRYGTPRARPYRRARERRALSGVGAVDPGPRERSRGRHRHAQVARR